MLQLKYRLALLTAMILSSPALSAEAPVLPIPALTPGAVDQAVTLDVICNRTTKERRRVSAAMKRAVFAAYDIPADQSAFYEIDHLVPLAIGGSNVRANLWPQAWAEADRKDVCEVEMQARACEASPSTSFAPARKV